MAEAPKPIRRSLELAPLSREHHEGLLAVWKIRQGLAKGIEAVRIVAFVKWFWLQHLQMHFKKEETFLPTVLSPSHPLMAKMFREHQEIKLMIELVPHEDLKNLETLAQTLNNHIRFEERQLFGAVEKAATPEQLHTLSEQLKDENNDAAWEDEFWITTR